MTEFQGSTYSWHQSHDQATVLLPVPDKIKEDEVHVILEPDILVAGVRGQPPLIKGRLYGSVDKAGSMWQLKPRSTGLSPTSTSNQQLRNEINPETSSGFADSPAGYPSIGTEDVRVPSLGSSPPVSSDDEFTGPSAISRARPRKQHRLRSVSPLHSAHSFTSSSSSSVESLSASGPGRLLTLHLEKSDSTIWPSLIVGPVSEKLSPCPTISVGSLQGADKGAESSFNMDPTSLTLTALELSNVMKDHNKAFEYFARAWLQAHLPFATMRLVSHYVPLDSLPDPLLTTSENAIKQGRTSYYIEFLGGLPGIARLYLEAGLLHLEGTAFMLLASSFSPLTSISDPSRSQYLPDSNDGSTAAWKRDQEAARRYFDRARVICPTLEVPVLPVEDKGSTDDDDAAESSDDSDASSEASRTRHRHTQREGAQNKGLIEVPRRARRTGDLDGTWYLHVPAGTALLAVAFIGVLSFTSWRKNLS